MEGALGLVVGIFWFIAAAALAILTLLIPVMIYSGQKSAFKCLHELKTLNSRVSETNAHLASLGDQIGAQQRALYELKRGTDLDEGTPGAASAHPVE